MRIEPAELCMGSYGKGDLPGDCQLPVDPDAQDDEKPAHRVTIGKAFLLAKHQVTFEEYDRYVDDHLERGMRLPSDAYFGARVAPEARKCLPVINVSWEDARDYAKWLSDKLDKNLRLPTEAEWEYAAQAGTETPRNPCLYANVLDSKNTEAMKNAGYTL